MLFGDILSFINEKFKKIVFFYVNNNVFRFLLRSIISSKKVHQVLIKIKVWFLYFENFSYSKKGI